MERISRILRIVFLTVGALASLLFITSLTLFFVLRPAGDHSDALRGNFLYLAIGGVCFVAAWRLKPPKDASRGFDVIPRPRGTNEGP